MLFGSFLSKSADAKTDRGQGGPVDSARVRHLKQQSFVGLLETWPLENEDPICAIARADPPLAHAECFHRQLLGIGPYRMMDDRSPLNLAPELHLWRHQLDGVVLHVQHR